MNNNPPYKPGTTLPQIIADGWSRDFNPRQTVEEAKLMGFDITIGYVQKQWADITKEFEAGNTKVAYATGDRADYGVALVCTDDMKPLNADGTHFIITFDGVPGGLKP